MKKRNKRPGGKKKILIALGVLTAAAAIGAGVFFTAQGSAEPVGVYPFQYLGMTEYWGDNQESYGPVTSDNIQTVFLTDTQIVTEIKVKEGDTVKKGDVLMTFDTTLSSLSLERKRLEVEKKKLNLEIAQRELGDILMLEPMEEPEWTEPEEEEEEEENLGIALTDACLLSDDHDYDGSSQEKALICWLKETTPVNVSLLEEIRVRSQRLQRENAEKEEAEEEDCKPGFKPVIPDEDGEKLPGEDDQYTEDTETTDPEDIEVLEYYVVFKTTQDNMSLGTRLTWEGLHVTKDKDDGEFHFQFYDASGFSDYTIVLPEEEITVPDLDFEFGYTLTQIVQMRNAKQQEIKQLEFDLKMLETEYKIMQKELEDGNIYAEVDGNVVSVLTEEEARQTRQPIIKVSGGGGFYVQCSITELEKDNLQIGQEVTVNDWNTGMTYTGTVDSMGDFPSADGYWNGMGNPNTTYYPFTVFIDGSADLQTYSYVSVMFSTFSGEHGIYLENPFLRTEQGKSYVFVLGAGGKLEKRYVATGKSLYGSYTEILSGITEEDLLAFPYGKNVREGAPAEERDISELYSY